MKERKQQDNQVHTKSSKLGLFVAWYLTSTTFKNLNGNPWIRHTNYAKTVEDLLCQSSSSGNFGYKPKQGTIFFIHPFLNWLRHIHLLNKSKQKSSWKVERKCATRVSYLHLNNGNVKLQSWVSRSAIYNLREEKSLAACEVIRNSCYTAEHCPPFMVPVTSLIMYKLNVLLSL